MISKNTIKRVNQLALKKFRQKEKLFLVEGDKMILELANSEWDIDELFITSEFEPFVKEAGVAARSIHIVTQQELKQISLQKTPQNALAVCKTPIGDTLPEFLNESLSVYLDSIQDPGNLGTILRICDWFGIGNIFVSPDTVDVFNPKVIQASMGSFSRVRVYECTFQEMKILSVKSNATLYGAFMEGANIYNHQLAAKAVLVMGNEGNGISEETEKLIDQKLSIPNFSENKQRAESLNVSVATAILCSEFKRRLI